MTFCGTGSSLWTPAEEEFIRQCRGLVHTRKLMLLLIHSRVLCSGLVEARAWNIISTLVVVSAPPGSRAPAGGVAPPRRRFLRLGRSPRHGEIEQRAHAPSARARRGAGQRRAARRPRRGCARRRRREERRAARRTRPGGDWEGRSRSGEPGGGRRGDRAGGRRLVGRRPRGPGPAFGRRRGVDVELHIHNVTLRSSRDCWIKSRTSPAQRRRAAGAGGAAPRCARAGETRPGTAVGGPASGEPGSGTPPFGASAPSSPPLAAATSRRLSTTRFAAARSPTTPSIVRLKDVASRSAWLARFSATLLSEHRHMPLTGLHGRARGVALAVGRRRRRACLLVGWGFGCCWHSALSRYTVGSSAVTAAVVSYALATRGLWQAYERRLGLRTFVVVGAALRRFPAALLPPLGSALLMPGSGKAWNLLKNSTTLPRFVAWNRLIETRRKMSAFVSLTGRKRVSHRQRAGIGLCAHVTARQLDAGHDIRATRAAQFERAHVTS